MASTSKVGISQEDRANYQLPTQRQANPVDYLGDLSARASMFTSKEGKVLAFAFALEKCGDFTRAVASAMIGIYMQRVESASTSLETHETAMQTYKALYAEFEKNYPKDEYRGMSKLLYFYHYMTKCPSEPTAPYINDVIDIKDLQKLFVTSEENEILRSIEVLKNLNLIDNEHFSDESGDYIARFRWTFLDKETWLGHYGKATD